MTLARDLAWQNLDMVYRSGIAHQYARYGLGLKFKDIPEEAVRQAKRSLLDSLGCAIGAWNAPGRVICEDTIREIGGPQEATVFGSGMRTSALNATLVNSFLVRYLDSNDMGGGFHSSDAIASILAVAERQESTGQDFLTAMIVSYELGARFIEGNVVSTLEDKGWTADVRGGLNMPPALGRLMGLNEDQVANAIGICASHSLPLGVLDAHREENTMCKNIRFGWVAYDAIMSCLLARHGFTGPLRVVEGDSGMCHCVAQGDMDFEKMTDFSGWRILKTRHKLLCANGTSIAHILATLAIVTENDLKPEDIASVHIKASPREALHSTTASKKWPRNGESADHSAFYGNALAIKERHFGPDAFEEQKYSDPVILDLIEKITVEADKTVPRRGGGSIITTVDGRRFEKIVARPHGVDDDPLTDEEIEDKVRGMAARRMGRARMDKLIDTVWNVEKLKDMGELASLMVFEPGEANRNPT